MTSQWIMVYLRPQRTHLFTHQSPSKPSHPILSTLSSLIFTLDILPGLLPRRLVWGGLLSTDCMISTTPTFLSPVVAVLSSFHPLISGMPIVESLLDELTMLFRSLAYSKTSPIILSVSKPLAIT
jgi:hypothetical protein